jgi:hypothetical protein
MEMINKYWALAQAHWTLVLLGFGVLAFIIMMAWFQQKRTEYDFLDTLMDYSGSKPRASLDNHITFFFALLAAWYIVVKTLYPAAGNVGADLVQILLVFLVYRLGRQGVAAWRTKEPPTYMAPPGDNVGVSVRMTGVDAVSTGQAAAPAAPDASPVVPGGSSIKTLNRP